MILPVNALTPKVCLGENVSSTASPMNLAAERRIVMLNSGGISAVTGAVTTAIVRNHTETWRQAGLWGIGVGLAMMLLVCPQIFKKTDKGLFNKHKEFRA